MTYYVITIESLYYQKSDHDTYVFVSELKKAHHFWNLEIARSIAKQFNGKIYRIIEVE